MRGGAGEAPLLLAAGESDKCCNGGFITRPPAGHCLVRGGGEEDAELFLSVRRVHLDGRILSVEVLDAGHDLFRNVVDLAGLCA